MKKGCAFSELHLAGLLNLVSSVSEVIYGRVALMCVSRAVDCGGAFAAPDSPIARAAVRIIDARAFSCVRIVNSFVVVRRIVVIDAALWDGRLGATAVLSLISPFAYSHLTLNSIQGLSLG